ncbi:MAG TPA: WYL domain-containing protein [Prosthecobacter sp.]
MKTLLGVFAMLMIVGCSPPPSVEDVLTKAIKTRRTVTIHYDHRDADGPQVVEPHLLGTTKAGEQMLNAWFLRDIPKSVKGPGWRLYQVKKIRSIELSDPFDWPRPDYDATGGKTFESIQAAL